MFYLQPVFIFTNMLFGKVKVTPLRNTTPKRRLWGVDIKSHSLHSDTVCRRIVSFTLWRLYPYGENTW